MDPIIYTSADHSTSLMSDYQVTLVNNKMNEFFVKFHGPVESECGVYGAVKVSDQVVRPSNASTNLHPKNLHIVCTHPAHPILCCYSDVGRCALAVRNGVIQTYCHRRDP
jgi:hypothetical protein